MKKLICITLILFSTQAHAIETDKIVHFSVSYGATLTSYLGFRKLGMDKFPAYLSAFVLVNTVGLLKEGIFDNKVDNGDLLANGLGSVAITAPILLLDF